MAWAMGRGFLGDWVVARGHDLDSFEYVNPRRRDEGVRSKRTSLETGNVVLKIIDDNVDELLWKVAGAHDGSGRRPNAVQYVAYYLAPDEHAGFSFATFPISLDANGLR